MAVSQTNVQKDQQNSENKSQAEKKDEGDLHKTFDVIMKSHVPTSKLKLVKYFKERMSMTLVQAKTFVEQLPQTVMSGAGTDDADQIVTTLTELGAEVTKIESKK